MDQSSKGRLEASIVVGGHLVRLVVVPVIVVSVIVVGATNQCTKEGLQSKNKAFLSIMKMNDRGDGVITCGLASGLSYWGQSQEAGRSGQELDLWWGLVGGLLPKPTTKLRPESPRI